MNTRQRAALFTRYAGLELKGKITARGFTAKDVAEAAHHSPAAFNRWLNGKVALPLAVLFEACEIIEIEPAVIVSAAHERVLVDDRASGGRGAELDVVPPPYAEERPADDAPLAAKRGRRKTEAESAD